MFQHAGAGDGAFLGHVADQEDRDVAALGRVHQAHGTLAQLADAAGSRLQLIHIDCLDGVDDRQLRLERIDLSQESTLRFVSART